MTAKLNTLSSKINRDETLDAIRRFQRGKNSKFDKNHVMLIN